MKYIYTVNIWQKLALIEPIHFWTNLIQEFSNGREFTIDQIQYVDNFFHYAIAWLRNFHFRLPNFRTLTNSAFPLEIAELHEMKKNICTEML